MSHETVSIFVMLNNYFHDLSVGVLFANVMLTLILIRLLEQQEQQSPDLLLKFVRLSFRVTWGALAFIVIGGVIRTLTYRSFEWAEAAGKGQVAALIVKHIILVGCTVAAIVFKVRMSRKYKVHDPGSPPGEGKQII
jgi:uncharacterized membrane protein